MKKSIIIMSLIILALLPLVPIQFAKGMRAHFGIVQLVAPDYKGSGTGFHILTPGGGRYIMTNAHVCASNYNGEMLAIFKDQVYPTKVVKFDNNKDLCLLEPVLDVIGVESYRQGIELLPVITSGFGGGSSITSNVGFKKSAHLIPLGKDCVPYVGCRYTELHISDEYDFIVIGGHSGSPVLSPFGALVGVVFAGDGKTSFVVPHSLIMEFLKDV